MDLDSAPKPGFRQATIYLVDAESSGLCSFWVGIAASGDRGLGQLLDEPNTAALLTTAATSGLREATPVMLTDTSTEALRSVLLMPIPETTAEAKRQWLAAFAAALKSWEPKAVGLYLAPEALGSEAGLDLLEPVVAELVGMQAADTVYLLTGGYGATALLNAALKLKAALQRRRVDLYVFH